MLVNIEVENIELLVKKPNSYYYPQNLLIEAEVKLVKLDNPQRDSFEIEITEAKAKDYDGMDRAVFQSMIRSSEEIEVLLVEAYPCFL